MMYSVLNSHVAFKDNTQKGREAGKSTNQSSSYALLLSVQCIRCLEKYVRMRQIYTGVFLMQSSTHSFQQISGAISLLTTS